MIDPQSYLLPAVSAGVLWFSLSALASGMRRRRERNRWRRVRVTWMPRP